MDATRIPCLCIRLRRAANAVSAKYDEALSSVGITIAQYALLKRIRANPRCSASQLSEQERLDRSTLARNLSRLLSSGMIVNDSPEGARNGQWRLTRKGEEALAAAASGWENAQRSALEVISDRDADLFLDTLNRLSNIKKTEEE